MNTTNTTKVEADSQSDADSRPPSRHGTHNNVPKLSAMCVPMLTMGVFTVHKQGGVSRLHTTRSGDALWIVSQLAPSGAAGGAQKGYRAWGLVFDFPCRHTRPLVGVCTQYETCCFSPSPLLANVGTSSPLFEK